MKADKMIALARGSNASRDAVRIEKAPSSRYARQQTRTKTRTSNACEACKRRKTKCTGSPSPCDVCIKAETYCCFNPKLDTRRKVAYTASNVQDRQQFMMTALLQTIKHSSEEDLQHLVGLIRGPSRPDAVAQCLEKHFGTLQSKSMLPKMVVDSTDVISFALQGLCGHRKGRPRPAATKTQPVTDVLSPGSTKSTVSDATTSTDSDPVVFDDDIDDQEATLVEGEMNESGCAVDQELQSAEMFELVVNELERKDELDKLDFHGRSPLSVPSTDDRPQFNGHGTMFPSRTMDYNLQPCGPFAQRLASNDMNVSPAYTMMPTSQNDFFQQYPYNQDLGFGMSSQSVMEYYLSMQQARGSV